MPNATKARTRYKSGHCLSAHHENCRGAYGGVACCCKCHSTCPACGQTLPASTP